MKHDICIHGVRNSCALDATRAAGIRVADDAPVLFTCLPYPAHIRTLPAPARFNAEQILPIWDVGPGQQETFLLLGKYPKAIVSGGERWTEVVVNDARNGDSTVAWPVLWKTLPSGQVLNLEGRVSGKVQSCDGVYSLVLHDGLSLGARSPVHENHADVPQPHPWNPARPQSTPQQLILDDKQVALPGGPYTLVHDGGPIGLNRGERVVSVDELDTLILGDGSGDGIVRAVYAGERITVAQPHSGKGPTTICLTMIVCNESKTIRRALENARNVADSFCICDTGSTDNTVEVVRAFLKETGVPGRVFTHPFRDFGYSRSVSWIGAQGLATYQLFLDADHVVQARSDFDKGELTADNYLVVQNTQGCTYWNLRLARDRGVAGCVGVTHEFWQPVGDSTKFDKLRVIDVGDGGCKQDKYERDERLLARQLVHTPADARTWFYLANTYRDRGKFKEGLDAYRKRSTLGGWMEEVWCSYLNMGRCHLRLGNTQDAITAFWDAHEVDPARAENLVEVARAYRENGKPVLAARACVLGLNVAASRAQNPRLLFVEEHCYAWSCNYELSLVRHAVPHQATELNYPIQSGIFKLLARCPLDTDKLIASHRRYAGEVLGADNRPATVELEAKAGSESPLWCAACTCSVASRETYFVLTGWEGEPRGSKAHIVWTQPGAGPSYAATVDTCAEPTLLGGWRGPLLLASAKTDSMLLKVSVLHKKLALLRHYPPNLGRGVYQERDQLMCVTSWVPFHSAPIAAPEGTVAPAPLPWRDVSIVASAESAGGGIWFLLRVGTKTPAMYSLFRTEANTGKCFLAWTFCIKGDHGDPCGLGVGKNAITIFTRNRLQVRRHLIFAKHLRWADSVHCV